MISNVLYENIILDAPEQWAIWIGPAQQSVSSSLCNPHPCRLTVMKITMVMMMVDTIIILVLIMIGMMVTIKIIHPIGSICRLELENYGAE